MEEKVKQYLYQYLLQRGSIDERLPVCADVEEKWSSIAEAYLPDGLREFAAYPIVSLGWMMFVGMAVVKYWDTDWEKFGAVNNLYEQMRVQRGYDCLDEYVLEDVLQLKGEELDEMNKLVAACASRVNTILCHSQIEAGTAEAFRAYVSCLHQLYLMGAAVQLKCMGYRMELL